MYVASVMSGANEEDVYPVGFMLVRGNKDGSTWTSFLTLLKEACPILSTQGFHDFVEGMNSLEHFSTIGIRFCSCQIETRV